VGNVLQLRQQRPDLTTAMTLAPGCRWMFRMIAGVLVHPAPSLSFWARRSRADIAEPHRRAFL